MASRVSATKSVAPLRRSLRLLEQAVAHAVKIDTAAEALRCLLQAASPVASPNLGAILDSDIGGHLFENRRPVDTSFPALDLAVTRWGSNFLETDGHAVFVKSMLPFIVGQAVRFHDIISDHQMDLVTHDLPTDSPKRVRTFTKEQLLCLLSNAFLCMFRRVSNNCGSLAYFVNEDEEGNLTVSASSSSMPSCNYDELLSGPTDLVHVSKLEMLLCYFHTMHHRMVSSASTFPEHLFKRPSLVIARGKAEPQITFDALSEVNVDGDARRDVLQQPFALRGAPLRPVIVHPLRHSIDDQRDSIRVDFANKMIGGAVSYGNVQEEITFALCPELHVSRIMFSVMDEDEAIVLVGAEQFSLLKPGTYGGNMACGGFPADQAAEFLGAKTSVIVAVDALDFRNSHETRQFSKAGMLREINKLSAGLRLPIESYLQTVSDHPSGDSAPLTGVDVDEAAFRSHIVSTGNWGCGVFRGDVMLKAVLQWLCCSAHGKEMHYFPFDREDVFEMGALMNALVERGDGGGVSPTAETLVAFLGTLMQDDVASDALPPQRGSGGAHGKRSRAPNYSRRYVLDQFASFFNIEVKTRPSPVVVSGDANDGEGN